MDTLIEAKGLSKNYGSSTALDNVSFSVDEGRIVGLIGPNGAGKTTALKAILGLSPFRGDLKVLGYDPYRQRSKLMEEVCFIADVAILPRWLKVSQAIEFVERVHPKFNPARAQEFLSKTEIQPNKKVKQLSKGMVAQLHLALVMAIDVRLLILDEPTLGLDILFRKNFYQTLLEDYFDENRTIIITTHQVEEIEHILTHLMFIQKGRLVLDQSMENIAEEYVEVLVSPDQTQAAQALGPIHERSVFGKQLMLFRGVSRANLETLGETHTPSVADLFVATMEGR
ncbi:MAG: ABC transporter ATP-binding protein [Pseudomonadota bacterium]